MHGFRKHFSTCLSNSDVNELYKKLFMGHSVQLDESYYDKTNEKSRQKCLKEYLKAVDSLTLSDENRLKLKVAEQEKTITIKLREKDNQIKKLQEQMKRVEDIMSDQDAYAAHLEEEIKSGKS